MGKAKKKKFSSPKNRPTGLPSVGECVAELEFTHEQETSSSAALQSLVEKLQSPNVECRECACATLANIVAEPGAIPALMKLNIVKILGPLILDPSWDIRHRAVGALRNMSVDGGSDVCEKMVTADVLTPVLVLLQQFEKACDCSGETKIKQVETVYETYTNLFYLLLNLCESSPLAVSLFNRSNLTPVLCVILNSDKFGSDLKLSVGEFLYTVSDNNAEIYKPELIESVQKCLTCTDKASEYMLLQILMTGVLVNFEGKKLTAAPGDLIISLINIVAEVLSVDLTEILQCLLTSQNGSDKNGEDEKTVREDILKNTQNILQAQKVALEIVTNLCYTDDDDWEDINGSESSSDDAMETGDIEMDTENNLQASICLSTELHTSFVKCDIVSKVLQASQPLNEDQSKTLLSVKGGKGISSKFVGKQIHALLCLSNLVSSLDVEGLGGVDRLHGIWLGLSQISVTQYCLESQELLEAVTSAMRAVIQKLTDVAPQKFQEVKPTDLQLMVEMATKCQWSEVRVNSLRVVSAIGTVLAQSQDVHVLLKDIGVLLLEVVCKDSDIWVKSEALDAIFDVFSEDHTDPVVREISLVEKLKTILPDLKSLIHANKKALGEHYPVISTAKTNLIRFIKYKSKQ